MLSATKPIPFPSNERLPLTKRTPCLKCSLRILTAFGLFSILAAAQSAHPASPAQLQEDIPGLMKKGEIPGLSIAVIHHGKTQWIHAFGVKDTKTNEPVTDATMFQAASLSKPVFAYGVLKLVDQGKLDLDAPLTKYVPDPVVEGDPRLEKITARLVLSHRSGLPNWRPDKKLLIYFTPGDRFSYSGEGMVYLQQAVEKITGKSLNDYMTEAVFNPLGMTSSTYVWQKDLETRMAAGHDDGEPQDLWKPDKAVSASSLMTTATDYSKFLEAVLTGKGLKPATLREMEKQQVAVDQDCTICTDHPVKELSKDVGWGLGWGVEQAPNGEAIWHWGDNGAFKAFVLASIKDKSGMVVFTNSTTGQSITRPLVEEIMGAPQPVFAWTRFEPYDSPGLVFAHEVREKGVSAALADFSADLKSGKVSEGAVNGEGYSLLRRKQYDDAIVVLEKNVELHPNSANTYDSLGEAYMAAGKKDLAIKNYEKSLQLNPENKNATAMLEKLRKE